VDVTKHLSEMFDRIVQPWTASHVLQTFGWSWKIPVRFQLQKYTPHNLHRYLDYVTALQTIDITKLRFLDEAHFVSKQLTTGKVLGLVNHRVWMKQNTLHEKNGTLTILTSLTQQPVVCTYTTANNTQFSFLDFVVQCCVDGDLNDGDFLVMDNAPVHSSVLLEVLEVVLEVFGVTLVFLPAYSPELNPCELVFNLIKNHIRYHRDGTTKVFDEMLYALAHVTLEHMFKFYCKCVFPTTLLPDLAIMQ